MKFDLQAHIYRQINFSLKAFGPKFDPERTIDHIKSELREISADPKDLEEWIDVIILALDGAWRAGWSPLQIVKALVAKQKKNEGRKWPDWRKAEPGTRIQHIPE